MQLIERFFHLRERNTTLAREVRGGVATFLTMAYILFANATILSKAGMDAAAVTACTALAAGICCIAMGFIANFPLALASGMGINAFIAFTITKETGSWQTAMALVVFDGVLCLVLVLCGLREAVMRAIPHDLRLAIGAGIGLFVAFIGLFNAGIVIKGFPPDLPLTHGSVHVHATLLALCGTVVTGFLMARRVPGSLLIGILATTGVALATGIVNWPVTFAMPSFSVAFQADFKLAFNGLIHNQHVYLPLLFSLVMIDFFDTIGSATAVAQEGGMIDDKGNIPNVKKLLLVDSASASVGGLLGASSVTSYVESAAGVAEGARTGLHNIVVGVLFLAGIFLAPLAGVVPAAATSPALILVGLLMMKQAKEIDFESLDTAIPAFITLITIPLTYSIAHGIGYGFIAYVLIQVLSLRFTKVHPLMYVTAVAFAAFFYFEK
jgi:AGZA family xanthine/uracil permease-like MFS transporter